MVADDRPRDPGWPTFEFASTALDPGQPDLVLALGLAHDVSTNVQSFVQWTELTWAKEECVEARRVANPHPVGFAAAATLVPRRSTAPPLKAHPTSPAPSPDFSRG